MHAAQLHRRDAGAVSASPPASTREPDDVASPVATVGGRAATLTDVEPGSPVGTASDSSPAPSARSRRRTTAPTLVGQPAPQAINEIRAAGLNPAIELHETDVPTELGVVLAQEPAARTELARGATLALWVGAPAREAPDALPSVLAPRDPVAEKCAVAVATSAGSAGAAAPPTAASAPDAVDADEFDDGWFVVEVADGEQAAAAPADVETDDEPRDRTTADTRAKIAVSATAAERGAKREGTSRRGTRRLAVAALAMFLASVLAVAALAGARHPSGVFAARGAQRSVPSRAAAARTAAPPRSRLAPPADAARRTVPRRRAPRRRARPAVVSHAPIVAPSSAPPTGTPTPPSSRTAPQQAARPAAHDAESPARREFFAP